MSCKYLTFIIKGKEFSLQKAGIFSEIVQVESMTGWQKYFCNFLGLKYKTFEGYETKVNQTYLAKPRSKTH